MTLHTRKPFFPMIACGLLVGSAGAVLAHGSERGLVMLLPTGYYQIGSALAVAASFFLLALAPAHQLTGLLRFRLPFFSLPPISTLMPSLLSGVILISLVAAGLLGTADPLANPLPLVIWTFFWVGLTLLQGIAGNLWPLINPWSGITRICRRAFAIRAAPYDLPKALGYLPALVQFAFFAWFELIDLAPEDPGRLASIVLAYWGLNLVAVLVFGEEVWFARGEPFAIFFRLIGHCSPIIRGAKTDPAGDQRISVNLGWPGAGFLDAPALPLSGILFVLLTLSSVSFDGFSRTFLWLGQVGINPLEFPGRSAVSGVNSFGLGLSFFTLACVYFAATRIGTGLIGRSDMFWVASGRLVYSIIPISLVFHGAHYLTALMINGQYLVLAFNDPFGIGWNMFGLEGSFVTTSFLQNLTDVRRIWNLQTGIIVTGHVLGILIAHGLAIELFKTQEKAAKSQVALAVFMVIYTIFGLWLLSTPSIG